MTPPPIDGHIRVARRSALGVGRPASNTGGRPARSGHRRPLRAGIAAAVAVAVALVLAGVGSRFASSSPDGLERVATDHGLAGAATDHALADSPVAGYSLRGVDDDGLATGASGVLGVVATLVIGSGVAVLVPRSRRASPRHPSAAPAPPER